MIRKKPVPWSHQTIQGMVNQPLGSICFKHEDTDYLEHKEAHAKGEGKRTYRGEVRQHGYYRVFCAITPEGLAGGWESPYIRRILDGEHGERFENEIRTSPLPGGTKRNLIQNMRNRHAQKNHSR